MSVWALLQGGFETLHRSAGNVEISEIRFEDALAPRESGPNKMARCARFVAISTLLWSESSAFTPSRSFRAIHGKRDARIVRNAVQPKLNPAPVLDDITEEEYALLGRLEKVLCIQHSINGLLK